MLNALKIWAYHISNPMRTTMYVVLTSIRIPGPSLVKLCVNLDQTEICKKLAPCYWSNAMETQLKVLLILEKQSQHEILKTFWSIECDCLVWLWFRIINLLKYKMFVIDCHYFRIIDTCHFWWEFCQFLMDIIFAVRLVNWL